jgi:pseudaminic acid cytidylyltransferase
MFAYIPARGGSKRLPGKNIRPLVGVPVIGHVIRALKSLDFINQVFVSTDDRSIAEIAAGYGAQWLGPRGLELSNDSAGFIDLMHHDVPRHADAAGGDREVLFVLATAALVPPAIYADAYAAWRRDRPNILMSVVPYAKSPYWALIPAQGGYLRPLFPQWVYVNSQELPPAYTDAGLFYLFDWQVMRHFDSHKNLDRLQPFAVDPLNAADVDTEYDWAVLEERFRMSAGTNH